MHLILICATQDCIGPSSVAECDHPHRSLSRSNPKSCAALVGGERRTVGAARPYRPQTEEMSGTEASLGPESGAACDAHCDSPVSHGDAWNRAGQTVVQFCFVVQLISKCRTTDLSYQLQLSYKRFVFCMTVSLLSYSLAVLSYSFCMTVSQTVIQRICVLSYGLSHFVVQFSKLSYK